MWECESTRWATALQQLFQWKLPPGVWCGQQDLSGENASARQESCSSDRVGYKVVTSNGKQGPKKHLGKVLDTFLHLQAAYNRIWMAKESGTFWILNEAEEAPQQQASGSCQVRFTFDLKLKFSPWCNPGSWGLTGWWICSLAMAKCLPTCSFMFWVVLCPSTH